MQVRNSMMWGDVPQTYCWGLQETSKRCTNRKSGIRTIEMLLGVSFETCLRHCEGVLMERRRYVHFRRFHDVPISCRGDVPLRCLGNVPPRRR